MARFYRRFKRKKRGKKRKWRQQKLAVGTVQRIAKQIARAEDNKHIRWLVHRNLFVSNTAWDTSQTAAPREEYKYVLQPNAYDANILSDIGNLTENSLVEQASGSVEYDRTMFYHVKSLQAFLCFENNTQYAVRCRVEMCYVPQLNAVTASQANNLASSITTFHGGVNLQFAGMFKKFQRTEGPTRADSPVFQLVAAKEFILPPAQQYQTPAPPAAGQAGIAGFNNTKRKYITLSKHYKRPKKLIWKSFVQQQPITGAQLCDNGNFIIQVMTDTTTLVSAGEMNQPIGVKYWGVGGCKYRIEAGRPDVPLTLA